MRHYTALHLAARTPALVSEVCEAEGDWDGTKRHPWFLRFGGQGAADH